MQHRHLNMACSDCRRSAESLPCNNSASSPMPAAGLALAARSVQSLSRPLTSPLVGMHATFMIGHQPQPRALQHQAASLVHLAGACQPIASKASPSFLSIEMSLLYLCSRHIFSQHYRPRACPGGDAQMEDSLRHHQGLSRPFHGTAARKSSYAISALWLCRQCAYASAA